VNSFYVHPAQVIHNPTKEVNIFGDNDLDFTFETLKFYPRLRINCSGMDNLYENFWKLVKQVGSKEFTQFFSSQGDHLSRLSYDEAIEVANVNDSISACATFLLIQCSLDGTPYTPGTRISKFVLYESLKKIKKVQKYLNRISFDNTEQSGYYLCLNEFERDFASRDRAILSYSLEQATKKDNSKIVSNIQFTNSKQLKDQLGNKFYINV
jgi:hypothetical protein